jgi:hypothetical protein
VFTNLFTDFVSPKISPTTLKVYLSYRVPYINRVKWHFRLYETIQTLIEACTYNRIIIYVKFGPLNVNGNQIMGFLKTESRVMINSGLPKIAQKMRENKKVNIMLVYESSLT